MKMKIGKGTYSINPQIVFAAIIVIQIAVICFWASERCNYFVDELFSFGYAHSYTLDKKERGYIEDSSDWEYDKWISNEILKEKLEVSESEFLFNRNPLTAFRMLFTGRNYHAILNILMYAFSSGKVSMWPPIIFNLFLFVLSQLLVFRIVNDLTKSFWVSLLAVFMYGFSGMGINTHIFIRFYALVNSLVLGSIRLHQKMWQENKIPVFVAECISGMLLLYLALKNSELILIMGGALVVLFTAALLADRQYRKTLIYVITIVPVSLLFLMRKTNLLNMMLHPAAYRKRGGAVGWVIENLLNVNAEVIRKYMRLFLRWFSNQLFGTWYVFFSFLIVILVLLEIKVLGKEKDQGKSEKGQNDCADAHALKFAYVILGIVVIYCVFAFLTQLKHLRYFSFCFPLVIILLWTLIDVMTKGLKYRRIVLSFCLGLLCVGILWLRFLSPGLIYYTYTYDEPLIQAVSDTDINKAVMLCENEERGNHFVYDGINLLPYTTDIYPVILQDNHIDIEAYPDRFLIWSNYYTLPDNYANELINAGYTIEELGGTHASTVYVASRG